MSNYDHKDDTSRPATSLSHIHKQAVRNSEPKVQDNVVYLQHAHITDPYDQMILGFGGNC